MKLQFSIRDLMWLALVAALAVGWWLHVKALSRELEQKPSAQILLERAALQGEVLELKAHMKQLERSK